MGCGRLASFISHLAFQRSHFRFLYFAFLIKTIPDYHLVDTRRNLPEILPSYSRLRKTGFQILCATMVPLFYKQLKIHYA